MQLQHIRFLNCAEWSVVQLKKTFNMASQPDSMYIRLHSDFRTNRSIYSNTVSDFENSLHSNRDLEYYNVGISDLHITGNLDINGLKDPQDWAITITETLPSFDEINFQMFDKWFSFGEKTEAQYRNKLIIEKWAFVSNTNYTTRITTPYSERNEPVKLRTDMYIRTDLTNTGFMDRVNEIKTSEKEVTETDYEIEIELEEEVFFLETNDHTTTYRVHNMSAIRPKEDFQRLRAIRVNEWKREKINQIKIEELENELDNYPSHQFLWQMGPISLDTFLKHILATLNTHPLYSFCSWHHGTSSESNKSNVKFFTDRDDGKIGQLDNKVKQILQTSEATIDPIKGLNSVNLHKEITFEYPNTFPVYLETTLVTHSLIGPEIRRIVKTIMMRKNSNDKVTYTKYFPQVEYYSCEKHSAITAIRMSLKDKFGSTVQFKSGEMTATLHCKKKTIEEK